MGISSSQSSPGSDRNGEKAAGQGKLLALSDIVKTTRRRRLAGLVANPFRSSPSETAAAKGSTVTGRGSVAAKRPSQREVAHPPDIDRIREIPGQFLRELRGSSEKGRPGEESTSFWISKELEEKLASYSEKKAQEYSDLRQKGTEYERSLGFDSACTKTAKPIEVKANAVFQHLKKNDIARFYETAPKKRGYRGQEHPRFYGDHFLSNADLIEQTQLFALCRAMPKGAHLHIHFNSNLPPSVLLGIAKDMKRMFIWSNIPLDRPEAYDLCRIQFSIMNEKAVEERGAGNLFHKDYGGGTVMQFQEFREAYPGGPEAADAWLQSKLVFQEEEAHNLLQTAEGAWEKFNARTQMMKGLFNYKTAYRRYTRQCLDEFVADNIQYAEIRPNFMSSNQVWEDDGSSRIDNVGIMNLIIDEYEAFQKDHQRRILKGLKIIYCTPRSFGEEQVGEALMQCFQFKTDKKFSTYIAGFDLVGEESKGKPLKAFTRQFLQFQALCKAADIEIPLLLHCGETLDIGTDTDGNLLDALLLGAKRIGHGFALPRHPYVMGEMKQRGVCVEVCPISNEILGLTPRISGHSVYNLLANNVPCTISADNGTLFRSRLSHDFYQIIAGKPDMTLHGLRQVVEWSIEHSCMEPELRSEVRGSWEKMWDEFCQRIVDGEFTLKDGAGEMAAEGDVAADKPVGGLPPV
ncbi:hypothetical protein MYCTH_2306716 [Thermothelomyces thermophilus ATCC 42464]|uniref:adenosine deaminase n=1 Tax=Thermothelomyces thermophilus (strain ATCC 42464 / BCRC 31852 / DSM 1799) TaxID=573729 RepID=G2QHT1_THET4|nr:uncharacterized protein MYCTH_2306716 [Thermothelomyces thermophilus ATCC 42464]AEO58941.1 hypothetical protein MYCTH_2306716 [Thermothelomyces thermophilus ATCC 42464]